MYTTEDIRKLIRQGREREFYQQWSWRMLSERVKREQHNECYFCKRRGKYSPAKLVHHIYELKEFPEYAYKRYYIDADGTPHINLVAVCHNCHEEQHNRGAYAQRRHYTNAERW